MKLLGKLPAYQNKSVLIKKYQKTPDIINEMLKAHDRYKKDYDNICDEFWKGNVYDTCRNLWKYLKKNVQYKIEPDTRQSVKSPSAILSTGRFGGYNDCKHYSLFFAGVLDSLKRQGKKIEWCYRFANYKLFSTEPHHVFVVVNPGKNEIWCDAVLSNFDEKKPYYNKIDKKPMALYSISGIETKKQCRYNYNEQSFSGFEIGRVRRKTKAGRFLQRFSRGGKKVVLAPNRNAFLLLVRLNVLKLAVSLKKVLLSDKRERLLETWRKLGGNPQKLIIAINKGVRKYERRTGKVGEPLTIAGAVALAVPIITALAKFLPDGRAKELIETGAQVYESTKSE